MRVGVAGPRPDIEGIVSLDDCDHDVARALPDGSKSAADLIELRTGAGQPPGPARDHSR